MWSCLLVTAPSVKYLHSIFWLFLNYFKDYSIHYEQFFWGLLLQLIPFNSMLSYLTTYSQISYLLTQTLQSHKPICCNKSLNTFLTGSVSLVESWQIQYCYHTKVMFSCLPMNTEHRHSPKTEVGREGKRSLLKRWTIRENGELPPTPGQSLLQNTENTRLSLKRLKLKTMPRNSTQFLSILQIKLLSWLLFSFRLPGI